MINETLTQTTMTKPFFPKLSKGYTTISDVYIKNVMTYLRKRVTARIFFTAIDICVEQESEDMPYSCTFITISQDDLKKMSNKIK